MTNNNTPASQQVPSDKTVPELPKPWGWLREVDGRFQISVGPDRPFCNERGGGYFTPWTPMFGGDQMQEYARAVLAAATPGQLSAQSVSAVQPVGHFQNDGERWSQVSDEYKHDADVVPLYTHPADADAVDAKNIIADWRGRKRLDERPEQWMRQKTYEQCADELEAAMAAQSTEG